GRAAPRRTREADAGRLQSTGEACPRSPRGKEGAAGGGRRRSGARENDARPAPHRRALAQVAHPAGGREADRRRRAGAARRAVAAAKVTARSGAGSATAQEARGRPHAVNDEAPALGGAVLASRAKPATISIP